MSAASIEGIISIIAVSYVESAMIALCNNGRFCVNSGKNGNILIRVYSDEVYTRYYHNTL